MPQSALGFEETFVAAQDSVGCTDSIFVDSVIWLPCNLLWYAHPISSLYNTYEHCCITYTSRWPSGFVHSFAAGLPLVESQLARQPHVPVLQSNVAFDPLIAVAQA